MSKFLRFKFFIYLLHFCLIFSALQAQKTVVIFSINDPHGRINNFSKIKTIIDAERSARDEVFFVSGGDLFSGNPIVDYHPNKGYPMIDLLNRTGLDISVIGNHEFDYGQTALNERITQANFPFICDNVYNATGALSQVSGHQTIQRGNVKISFIGVVETSSSTGLFPLTHPKKIEGLTFSEGLNSFPDYQDIKSQEGADVVIALTHYGKYKDEDILENYDFVDLVIGGHSNHEYGTAHSNGYMVMSGAYLNKLSKTTLTIENQQITDFAFEMIDLNDSNLAEDNEIKSVIEEYNNIPEFFTVIGSSGVEHTKNETACFYTDALRTISNADIVIQNMGGVRDILYEGDITPFSVYSIDPFGNGFDTFEMTVSQLRTFFEDYTSSFTISTDLSIVRDAQSTLQFYSNNTKLDDNHVLKFSLNDYISNVYSDYFPTPFYTYPLTTADYIIEYLDNVQSGEVNYESCLRREYNLSVDDVNKVYRIEVSYESSGSLLKIDVDHEYFKTNIFDVSGRLVSFTENKKTIPIESLPDGIYFLKIFLSIPHDVQHKKVIKY